jgi:WD40 repeat protein
VQIWDATTGKVSLSYSGHTQRINAIAWSPDGKRLASVSENVQVWDAANGKRIYTIESSGDLLSQVVAWSPDGKYLASSSTDKTVQVWQAP